MRKGFRRHAAALTLVLAGAALLLAGAAASVAHLELAGSPAPARADPPAERVVSTGLEAGAVVALDTPLAPVEPVNVHAAPRVARALPLPGASVDREVALDEAGLALRADLDLASGSHRARTQGVETQAAAPAHRLALASNPAPVAVAAAAFTLAGALAYFWSGVKAWGARVGFALAPAPLVGLYAKITRAEVFDNGVRERIFAAIRAHPGVSASDLARLAGVSWGTTIYHLDVLEQTRMVSSLRKGRYRRYFENGAQLAASKDVVAVLQNPVTAGVVDTLRRAPGVTQKELASATSMTPQALHWHLARLVAAGVVRKERAGRVVRHYVSAN